MGRVFGLLFSDDERRPDDATSVVGISQQVGVISGEAGAVEILLQLFGFVTVFVGLINLVPLPPFDGGHLATLLIEKVRGKAVDMRTLIPVSAAVMAFFVLFVGRHDRARRDEADHASLTGLFRTRVRGCVACERAPRFLNTSEGSSRHASRLR